MDVEIRRLFHVFIVCIAFATSVLCQPIPKDATIMQDLKKSIPSLGSLNWSDPNPCYWDRIKCSKDNRVTAILLGKHNLQGLLPSLGGLSELENLKLNNNNFSGIPSDFFQGMISVKNVALDYNPFSKWTLPLSLISASKLQRFSAKSTNLTGEIPDIIGGKTFPALKILILADNNMTGVLPDQLKSLPELVEIDISNNRFIGRVPLLKDNVTLIWHGNDDLDKNDHRMHPSDSDQALFPYTGDGGRTLKSWLVVGVILAVLIGGILACNVYGCKQYRRRNPNRNQNENQNTGVEI